MNCLIVDDNRADRLILRKICESVDFIHEIQDFGDPIMALQLIRKSPVELLILDIEMPGLNGLDFLKIDNSPAVILVSGKSEYAINAFDLDVLDYVLKPTTPERMHRALEKARLLTESRFADHIADQESIFIRDKGTLLKIDLEKILFFHSLGDYITIVTNVKKYTIRLTLKNLEARVCNSNFIRVHRSYIIALNKVESVDENLIGLANHLIPVGEMYRSQFFGRLNLV